MIICILVLAKIYDPYLNLKKIIRHFKIEVNVAVGGVFDFIEFFFLTCFYLTLYTT